MLDLRMQCLNYPLLDPKHDSLCRRFTLDEPEIAESLSETGSGPKVGPWNLSRCTGIRVRKSR